MNRKTIFFSHEKDWKMFKRNNKSIALNVLFIPHKKKEIRQAYISKNNSERQNHVILLMIKDSEKWHYLTVKSLFRLLQGITSN